MDINVFGLGYVGCVSAACLANKGHRVSGIDIDETKISAVNEGRSPIIEAGLDEAIKQAIASGNLRATRDDLQPAEVSLICVGTPSNENGSLRLTYIQQVSREIGEYLRTLETYHVVAVRSTVLPGTIEKVVLPLLEEHSGKRAGVDFGLCMNPEFMREGVSIQDYHHPPFTLIGELDERCGEVIARLYEDLEAPIFREKIKIAEMVKYVCNSFHALKITFANEVGNICKSMDIDSHAVMDIFCQDTTLNLSPYYLKPGFAFGGSCLPKDLRAIAYKAREMDLETPVLSSILNSNSHQVESSFKMIEKTGKKKVGVLGLSFKAGTDDLRESPMVTLIEKLIGKGYSVSIYDKEVSLAKIFGSNKTFIETAIPHISSLLKNTSEEVVADSEVLVIGNRIPESLDVELLERENKHVVDLVKTVSNPEKLNGYYQGICW